MIFFRSHNFSLRNRLLIQLILLASILSIIMFFGIRAFIGQTITATQDGLLNAAIGSIMEKVRIEKNEVYVDLPYDTFSILGAFGEDRVFYRLDQNKNFLTGYNDFPKSKAYGNLREPFFQTINYKGDLIRTAAIKQLFTIKGEPTEIYILIGQTQNFQSNILQNLTANIFIIVFVFFIIAIFLSFITTTSALRPVNLLAKDVRGRGPQDLREVKHPTPIELRPLLNALNGFIRRLRGTLRQTEIFIAEAAHHIRTPLATVKSESELALRKSKKPEMRVRLKKIIRSVEQTNRSSAQLLEHAMVLYRAEKKERERCKVNQIIEKIIDNYRPAADFRDIKIEVKLLTSKDITILLDRTLLELALRNLIDNAIKYSPAENIIFIQSDLTENNKYMISIENISEKSIELNKEQLFKRFTRGTNHDDIIGTGLGLAIVSEGVRALKGKFNIEIQKGKKLCAILHLPLS